MEPPSNQLSPKTRVIDLGAYRQEFPPGTRVDRYEIISTLGSGGCGVVYAARHVHLEQTVALKLLHRSLINSEERVQRFFREARASAAVGNAHIVRVSDCGLSPDGVPFLAMEFLKGAVLEDLVGNGEGLPLARAVEIELQILDGLEAAHEAGVVHRDLKPENIFLIHRPHEEGEFVKIVDFGVSKVFKDSEHYQAAITGTGALLGTPRYMAPEQFRGAKDVDHRADLFAAAVVLFQMLSGQLPFEGRSPLELAHRACTEPPRSLEELSPHVPEDVVEVVLRGLEKEPADRWPSAFEFANALRVTQGIPPLAPRPPAPSPSVPPHDLGSTAPSVIIEDDNDPTFQTSSDDIPIGQFADQFSMPNIEDPLSTTTPDSPLGDPFAESALVDTAPENPDDLVDDGRVTFPSGSHPAASSSIPEPAPTPAPESAPALEPAPAPESAPALEPAPEPIPEPTASSPELQAIAPESLAVSNPPSLVETPALSKSTGWVKVLFVFLGVFALAGGLIFGLVVLTPGDSTPGGISPQSGGDSVTAIPSVTFGTPRITGDIDITSINLVLTRAQPHMEMCRRPGEPTHVSLEAHVAPPGYSTNRLSLVRAVPGTEVLESVTSCCVEALRAGVPNGWNPGQSGIVTVDITLPGR